MNMKTLDELKLAAAMKLPDKLTIHNSDEILWIAATINYPVKETEWLYIVHLLEGMMSDRYKTLYAFTLTSEMTRPDLISEFNAIHATYQKRLTAMNEIGFI